MINFWCFDKYISVHHFLRLNLVGFGVFHWKWICGLLESAWNKKVSEMQRCFRSGANMMSFLLMKDHEDQFFFFVIMCTDATCTLWFVLIVAVISGLDCFCVRICVFPQCNRKRKPSHPAHLWFSSVGKTSVPEQSLLPRLITFAVKLEDLFEVIGHMFCIAWVKVHVVRSVSDWYCTHLPVFLKSCFLPCGWHF